MANEIRFTFSAEGKHLDAELTKLEKQVDRLQDKIAHSGKSGRDAFSGIGKEMTGVVQGLIGPASVSGAVLALVGTVKSAYAEMKEEHRGFMRTLESESEAKARFLYNASQFAGGKVGAEAFAARASASSGVGKARIYDIGATAFSAAGGMDQATVESAIATAAMMERTGLGKGDQLVGSALDLAKATGRKDAASNFGFGKQVGASARTVTLEAQMNLTPGILAGVQAGATPEQSGELVAALSNVGTDAEGSETSTAMTRLMQALKSDELVPGKGKKWGRLKGTTPTERIAELQGVWAKANVAQKAEIQTKIGGRGRMVPAMEEMFGNTPLWQETLGAMQQKIGAPGSPESMAEWNRFGVDMSTGQEGVVGGKKRMDTLLAGAAGAHIGEAADTTARDAYMAKMRQQGMAGQMGATAIAAADPAMKVALLALAATTGSPSLVKAGLNAGVPTAAIEAGARAASGNSEADQAFFATAKEMREAARDLKDAAEKMRGKPQTSQELD